MNLHFNTIVQGHAVMYTDGYSVKVQTDNGATAGFPFLCSEHPGRKAWSAAVNWARHYRGCRTIEILEISDASLRHILQTTDAMLS